MQRLIYPLILTITLVSLGCASRPEGPAEKIGRGVDQILEGGLEMQDRYGDAEGLAKEEADPRFRNRAPKEDPRHNLNSDEWWKERERNLGSR
jgi:hypothetical protein